MRILHLSIPLVACICTLSSSNQWNEDPRCSGGRRLSFDPTKPDNMRLAENALRDMKETGMSKTTIFKRPDEVIFNKSLRGSQASSHRQLDTFRFQMKLYWEEGYCWQEEWDEREWCLECDNSPCEEDNLLWLQKCDGTDDEQWFVYESINAATKSVKLKPYTRQDLCWTRTGVNEHRLKSCGNGYLDDQGRDVQVLIGFQESGAFEPQPNGRSEPGDCDECPQCMNNPHHPKANEAIYADSCENARGDHTSLYIVHNPSGEGTSTPSAPSDTLDCGEPEMCTTEVLDADANGSTCRARIEWLINTEGKSQEEACHLVANEQSICKPCEPILTSPATTPPSTPPPSPFTPSPSTSAATPPPSTFAPTTFAPSTFAPSTSSPTTPPPSTSSPTMDCGVPDTCTTEVLNTDVKGITCGDRIQWVISTWGKSQEEACRLVANEQSTCKPCDPGSTSTATTPPSSPPPATSAGTSPPATSLRTSSSSACVDSAEEFFVNEDTGSRDCTWLYDNQDRFGYLCRFVDVALECPVTCNICDHLKGLE